MVEGDLGFQRGLGRLVSAEVLDKTLSVVFNANLHRTLSGTALSSDNNDN